jgi:hypothetical protein
VANYVSVNVSVLLGNADGTFQAAQNFETGSGPSSVAVGDFNGDGRLDLVVANIGSNTVSVLLGNGDGTFRNAQNFGTGFSPGSVAVGDFDGDGRLDLAVAYAGRYPGFVGGVSVLLGNGDGTFQAAQSFASGASSHFVAVGDFNGDGVQDLAVIYAGGVAVLLGNGDGSFQAAHSFAAGNSPTCVAVGDFNGDGNLDLAVANSRSNTVSVFLGNGDGRFQTARTFTTGEHPVYVAVGELNGDGKQDIAVVNDFADDVAVLLGNGDGTFQDARHFGVGNTPQSAAVGDFNGDGRLDLAVANYGSDDISVLLGNGDGTFPVALSLRTGAFTRPSSVAVGDFNADGVQDLVVANSASRDVSALLGNGDGTFQNARNFGAGISPSSVAVGDFDGDGRLDLAVAYAGVFPDYVGGVSVLLGNGDGSFQAAQNFGPGKGASSVAVGDFDGDGRLDLAVAYAGRSPDYVGGVSVLLGNGDGSFQAAQNFGTGNHASFVAVGDFDGDGRLDLAVAYIGLYPDFVGGVSVLLGNGDGSFQASQNYGAGNVSSSVAVGDFNGDGRLDLAVAYAGSYPDRGGVSMLLGNGDGSFQAAQNFGVGNRPSSVAVGDFDGDGRLDLVVASSLFAAYVSVLLGNGDGTFRNARNFGTDYFAQSVAVGDFNSDGWQDLAVAGGLFNVSVLINNTPP